jgi:hypothetical protein
MTTAQAVRRYDVPYILSLSFALALVIACLTR